MRHRALVTTAPMITAVAVLATGCGHVATVLGHGDGTPTAVASEPRAGRELRFGQHFDTPSGIRVTLSAPVPYAPSNDALTDDSARYVRFTLTVANHSDDPLVPEAVLVTARAGHRVLRAVVDGAKHIGQAVGHPIGPSETATIALAFGLPAEHTTLTVSVDPSGGSDHEENARYVGDV